MHFLPHSKVTQFQFVYTIMLLWQWAKEPMVFAVLLWQNTECSSKKWVITETKEKKQHLAALSEDHLSAKTYTSVILNTKNYTKSNTCCLQRPHGGRDAAESQSSSSYSAVRHTFMQWVFKSLCSQQMLLSPAASCVFLCICQSNEKLNFKGLKL